MPETFLITRRPIDTAAVMRSVKDESAGGTVLFLGTVRNRSHGKEVTGLEYEAYTEMAEKRMKEIAKTAKEKWPVMKIAMVHRYGELKVGEVSVAVAVSSEHRGDAFQACRYAIDTIKRSLPLWKKEKMKSGAGVWVKGRRIED